MIYHELHLQKLCPIFGVQFTRGRLFLFSKIFTSGVFVVLICLKTENSYNILVDVITILHLK